MYFSDFEKSYAPRVDKKPPPLGMLKVVESPKELELDKDVWVDYNKMLSWSVSHHNNESFEYENTNNGLVKMRIRGMIKGYDSVEGYKGYRKFLLDAVKRRSMYVYKR